MRVSNKWLQEYVDFDLSPEELASRLTMAGIAVEAIEPFGADVTGVVAGLLKEVTRHPDSDHLLICQVGVAADRTVQVVTGAPNVAVGQTVPVALAGATLAGGVRIGTSLFRGVESEGMLCSAAELGISDKETDGILILPEPVAPGTDLIPVLGLGDSILELELTANRSDCLCMLGVAREVATVLQVPLHLPEVEVPEAEEKADELAGVVVLDPNYCPRYVARVFTGVKVGPSPLWLQQRLRAAGMRPINNVVDVTNYVMLEMNQPLHAFDYDLLADHRIVVRRAGPGETLLTLDDQERRLEPTDLVIADGARGVAIAGVMGGANTEVSAKTTRILLESACFHPAAVRRAAKRLGLRSEASLRFEKGVDAASSDLAADRAAQLLARLGACQVTRGRIDVYPVPVPKRSIRLRPERVNNILGTNLDKEAIQKTLGRLPGVSVTPADGAFEVSTPSFRQDLVQEIDLIEEVARLHGYGAVPATLPQGISTDPPYTPAQLLERSARHHLLAAGLTEVVTNSLTNGRALDNWAVPESNPLRDAVRLMVPLTEEMAEMRTTLLPSLMEVAARNASRRETDLQVFEIDRVFHPVRGEALPVESQSLAGVLTGKIEGGEWSRPAREVDFFDVKGLLEGLLARIGAGAVVFERHEHPGFHPGRTARVSVAGVAAGIFGEVHPRVMAAYGLAGRCYAFEFDFSRLAAQAGDPVKVSALPKFPAVTRDLAIVVPEEVEAGGIFSIIQEAGGELVENVRLFDVYRGQQVESGKKSLAFSVTYRAGDRTLTDAEVQKVHRRIGDAILAHSGWKLRVTAVLGDIEQDIRN